MFITFEGGEGTGKSTQVKLLAERFRAEGKTVLTTREPGGTPDAEALRNLLVSGAPNRWTANEELLLNFASRGSHLRHVILPALADNIYVICDRFIDSSYVYQVVAGGAHKGLYTSLLKTVALRLIPDVTFILDLPPRTGRARAIKRISAAILGTPENRFELKDEKFHHKVRRAFIEIADKEPARCHLIDAAASELEVADRIWAKLHG